METQGTTRAWHRSVHTKQRQQLKTETRTDNADVEGAHASAAGHEVRGVEGHAREPQLEEHTRAVRRRQRDHRRGHIVDKGVGEADRGAREAGGSRGGDVGRAGEHGSSRGGRGCCCPCCGGRERVGRGGRRGRGLQNGHGEHAEHERAQQQSLTKHFSFSKQAIRVKTMVGAGGFAAAAASSSKMKPETPALGTEQRGMVTARPRLRCQGPPDTSTVAKGLHSRPKRTCRRRRGPDCRSATRNALSGPSVAQSLARSVPRTDRALQHCAPLFNTAPCSRSPLWQASLP
jgi:hypothetical protein